MFPHPSVRTDPGPSLRMRRCLICGGLYLWARPDTLHAANGYAAHVMDSGERRPVSAYRRHLVAAGGMHECAADCPLPTSGDR